MALLFCISGYTEYTERGGTNGRGPAFRFARSGKKVWIGANCRSGSEGSVVRPTKKGDLA